MRTGLPQIRQVCRAGTGNPSYLTLTTRFRPSNRALGIVVYLPLSVFVPCPFVPSSFGPG